MLHNANSFSAGDCQQASETDARPGRVTRPEQGVHTPGTLAGGRYGEQRSLNFSAIGLTILIHALVIAALLGLRHHVVQREEQKLVTVNLTPPPPPPPATPENPETPKQPVVTAPRPLIQIDVPQKINVPVTVDPQPAPPTLEPVQQSAPAPVAAPPSVIQGGDLGARMVSGKPPRYPVESRRQREQGTVVLSLVLGTDGAVEQISINRSSGFSRLDDAALHAVRRWRWEPVVRGGAPVKVRGIVEIPFVLQGESQT